MASSKTVAAADATKTDPRACEGSDCGKNENSNSRPIEAPGSRSNKPFSSEVSDVFFDGLLASPAGSPAAGPPKRKSNVRTSNGRVPPHPGKPTMSFAQHLQLLQMSQHNQQMQHQMMVQGNYVYCHAVGLPFEAEGGGCTPPVSGMNASIQVPTFMLAQVPYEAQCGYASNGVPMTGGQNPPCLSQDYAGEFGDSPPPSPRMLLKNCGCGAMFLNDCRFCRMCGATRDAAPKIDTCCCGIEFKDDSQFCHSCGARRSIVPAQASAHAVEPERLEKEDEPDKCDDKTDAFSDTNSTSTSDFGSDRHISWAELSLDQSKHHDAGTTVSSSVSCDSFDAELLKTQECDDLVDAPAAVEA